MSPKIATLATSITLVVLIAVGFVDAIRDDNTGTAVLFAIIMAGVITLTLSSLASGSITLRRDLASWLDRTSTATGESADDLGSRAVSRLRAGFSQDSVNEG